MARQHHRESLYLPTVATLWDHAVPCAYDAGPKNCNSVAEVGLEGDAATRGRSIQNPRLRDVAPVGDVGLPVCLREHMVGLVQLLVPLPRLCLQTLLSSSALRSHTLRGRGDFKCVCMHQSHDRMPTLHAVPRGYEPKLPFCCLRCSQLKLTSRRECCYRWHTMAQRFARMGNKNSS